MLAVLRDLLCRFCDQSADLAPMLLSFDRAAGQGKACVASGAHGRE
jgi:hypothetical protein